MLLRKLSAPNALILAVAAMACCVTLAQTAQGRNLDTVRPAKEGMSSERLQGLDAQTVVYVEKGTPHGLITMIAGNRQTGTPIAPARMAGPPGRPSDGYTPFAPYWIPTTHTSARLIHLIERGND